MSARDAERDGLRYSFAPVPSGLAGDRALTDKTYRLLGFLRDRIDRRRADFPATIHTVPLTLERIERAVDWKAGALGRQLRRLQARGRLAYTTRPGSHGAEYVFRLPNGLRFTSEECPRREAPPCPRSDGRESPMGSGLETPTTPPYVRGAETPLGRNLSEEAEPMSEEEEAAKPHEEPHSTLARVGRVLGAQKDERGLSREGGLPGLSPEDRPLADLMERARETAVRNGSSALGDPGFLTLLHDRYRAGALTRSEWLGRVELHGLLWRARPVDEEQLLGEVGQLVAEGALLEVGS